MGTDNLNTNRADKTVAIVVPFYKEKLTPDEEISFKHLVHFLGKYERYLVLPESLKVDYPGFKIKTFNDSFFKDTKTYTKMLLSRQFYEAFIEYKHILIYQLDCLVFSDQLSEWCEMDYDYIGAPWLKSLDAPEKGWSRVGNGGFSLRKVDSFLKVIDSKRYVEGHASYWIDFFSTPLEEVRHIDFINGTMKKFRVFREIRKGINPYISNYASSEDHFWSDRAKLFYPDFKIAPMDAGLRFSFETFPEYCFKQNKQQLPFGCHAWARWNRKFWEPYLLK